ncbi:MAG TPA: sulfurtransferase TusA family protein [Anaerolineales bacterium]|nr:sulfurtransferase TusA family protein [Anaerolineales bacterium]
MSEIDLTTLQVTKKVDARAMACPGPLLEAKKSMGAVKVGDILEIWSGDKTTRDNLSRWCTKLGHEYLGVIDEGGYDRLFVKRKI